jgi:glycosyltransferase involved in cell wall biosynthesis
MRIALIGTRGVPAAYSGFETCAEQLGKRLAARGHHVVVYCRSQPGKPRQKQYQGMQLVTVPCIRTKGLETLSHTALSTLHAILISRPDATVVFGVGNAIFGRLLRVARIPSAINVDGADWLRLKWGFLGRSYLRLSRRMVISSAAALIADSRSVAADYQDAGERTVLIPYGAEVPPHLETAALNAFGLRPRGYLLAVGRMVPENGFHHLIEAYARSSSVLPLVIVGDAPYAASYKKHLRQLAPPTVIFTGYQFGSPYHELSANAYAFLFAAEVGGTHPVLVEQLAHGNCVLARSTDSNVEVIGEAGLTFQNQQELMEKLQLLLDTPELVERYRTLARARARLYSWDEVTDSYERLLSRLSQGAVRPGFAGRAGRRR